MIYFDAAATTLQKPHRVRAAVVEAMLSCSSPSRGGYQSAARASQVLFRCRQELGALLGEERIERIVFTQNATHALNIAIRSLVPSGAQVVISGYEHNAVTRTLHAIGDVHVHVVNTPLFDSAAMLKGFDALVNKDTSAVICTHVSNVFGFILPIEGIAKLCRARKVPLIVDASQSAGILPIDQKKLQAAFIAMPGHKGLYGPQGTGVLLCGEQGQPLLFGGTGSASKEQHMPEDLPDRLEAGTHNTPGIAGLLEGVRFVRKLGNTAAAHERHLKERLFTGLSRMEEYECWRSSDGALQCGVMSFRHRTADPEALCDYLSHEGFALRGGFHCAPFAHKSAGTDARGTVRFSPSVFNREREVDSLLASLKKFTN